MTYAVSYLAPLLVFIAMDAVWLSSTGNSVYRPTLGDIMLPNANIPPAVVFYLLYPIGLAVFAVSPALKEGSVTTALMLGALLGFVAYAAYDLSNFATLRNWTLQLTLIDMAWGTFASAVASALGYLIAKSAIAWLA